MLSIKKIRKHMNSKTGYHSKEMMESYQKELAKAAFTGNIVYGITSIIFVVCDFVNYFQGLYVDNSSYEKWVLVSFSISMILNRLAQPIFEYIFWKHKDILDKKQRIVVSSLIIFGLVIIISLIFLHFHFRIKSIYILTEELPEGVAKSITYITSFLPLATTVASSIYTAINIAIMIPRKINRIKARYTVLAGYVKDMKVRELNDHLLSLNYRTERRYLNKEHDSNNGLLRAKMNYYKALRGGGQNRISLPASEKKQSEKKIHLFQERKVN